MYHKHHKCCRTQNDHSRTHVIADFPDQQCNNTWPDHNIKHGQPALDMSPLCRQQCCHKDDHQYFDRLCHLYLYWSQLYPPGRLICRNCQWREQQRHEPKAGKIAHTCKPADPVIVNASHHQHGQHSHHTEYHLSFQEVHGIVVKSRTHSCFIITGTIDHDKAKYHDKKKHNQKVRIHP